MPSRLLLIDHSEDIIYLQEMSQQASAFGKKKVEYVALSYCWGRSRPWVTTMSNIIEHYRGIDIPTLPKTFRDAISVTRLLGIQLLWIDALCIVQDDEADVTEQLSRMKVYYQNAKVTLANSKAADVDEGFLTVTGSEFPKHIELKNLNMRLPTKCHIPYYDESGTKGTIDFEVNITVADDNEEYDSDHDDFYDERKEPLNKRAWTLQERWLSPRILSFPTFDGFTFQCNTEERLAGDYCLHDQAGRLEHDAIRRRLRFGPERLDSGDLGYDEEHERFRTEKEWIYIVHDYSQRSLSNPLDKLTALGGLAELFSSRYEIVLGSYAAGHWFKMLPLSLYWMVYETDVVASPQQYLAPSWSWASVDSGINFPNYGKESDMPIIKGLEAKVLDLHVELSSSKVRFGAVKHARLQLEGAVLAATLHYEDEHHGYGKIEATLEDGRGSDLEPIHLGRVYCDTIESRPLIPRKVTVLMLGLVSRGSNWDGSQMSETSEMSEMSEIDCLIVEEVGLDVFKRTGSMNIAGEPVKLCLEHSQQRKLFLI